MILVDDRIGSVELAPYLKQYGLDVQVCRLDSGDCSFVGNGPDDQDMSVGIERKRLTDLLACIRDKRLSGFQLIGDGEHEGLLESFDYVYLFVEGIFRPGANGIIETWSGDGWHTLYLGASPMLYLEMDSFLASLELRAVTRVGEPVRVHRTSTIGETACQVATLHHNWTGKRWSQHRAHYDIYSAPLQARSKKAGFVKPRINLPVKWAAQLSGVHDKAFEIGKYFKSARWLANATVGKWAQIDGIGKTMAKRIVEEIEREY